MLNREPVQISKYPHNNNYMPNTREQNLPENLSVTVDSDYDNDVQHRKSVTGINTKITGGSICYIFSNHSGTS